VSRLPDFNEFSSPAPGAAFRASDDREREADPQGNFPPPRPRAANQIAVAADGACKHLLSSGGTATPQQRQQRLVFGVTVAECLRTHGYPIMPDPSGQSGNQLPPGIDPNSPHFRAAENGCEQQARKVLGLPVNSNVGRLSGHVHVAAWLRACARIPRTRAAVRLDVQPGWAAWRPGRAALRRAQKVCLPLAKNKPAA
jgi:hypothetical protein